MHMQIRKFLARVKQHDNQLARPVLIRFSPPRTFSKEQNGGEHITSII